MIPSGPRWKFQICMQEFGFKLHNFDTQQIERGNELRKTINKIPTYIFSATKRILRIERDLTGKMRLSDWVDVFYIVWLVVFVFFFFLEKEVFYIVNAANASEYRHKKWKDDKAPRWLVQHIFWHVFSRIFSNNKIHIFKYIYQTIPKSLNKFH